MKNMVVCVVSCLFFLHGMALVGNAQNIKIGYIDLNRIVEGSKQGREKREQLEKILLKKKEEGSVLEDKIQEMKKEYTEKELNLSDNAKMKMEEEIQNEIVKLQRLGKDAKAYLQRIEMRSKKELLDIITSTVKNFGKENGYSIILNNVEAVILYSSESLDVTDQIIDILNKQ